MVWSTRSSALLIFPGPCSVGSGAHRAQFARIRKVGKLFNPVGGGLGGIREHMAQCRDVTVNRLTRDRVVRKGDGYGGPCGVPVDPHVDLAVVQIVAVG